MSGGPRAERVAGVIGAVLAGGAGSRLGGDKAIRTVAGRPLIAYPLAALAAVCERVVVVAKPDTNLETLAVESWLEPPAPRHPATGIVHAVERASSPVLVCAADMPFVTADACRALVSAARSAPEADAIVATAGGLLEPLFAVYRPSSSARLRASLTPGAALRATLEPLDVVTVALPAEVVRSVNTPEELDAAERELAG